MKNPKISDIIDEIVKEMELKRDDVIEAFKEGMIAGCKKEYGVLTCRCEYDEVVDQFSVFTQKLVVDEIVIGEKEMTHILIEDAKKIQSKIKVGEILEVEVSPENYGYHASSQVKQSFNQILNKKVKERVFEYFKSFKDKLIPAQVVGIDEKTEKFEKRYRLNIGHDTITTLHDRDTLPNDNLQIGDRINVYVLDIIQHENRSFRVVVTRTDQNLINRLMENYIPEIKEGIVEIVAISRTVGDRSKVMVKSNDPNVDPIGACIGTDGMRIRGVMKALNGEKIDLFKYSDNPQELIANSLQPARVIAVTEVNELEKTALAIVQDDHLSLAIGKKGQNVQLAVQATGWKIDIKSEEMAAEKGILY